MWECPGLFELPVRNVPGETKWVFWSADGFYLVGDFDGYRFEPESEVQSAYSITLPYAAQTYAGIEDRIISIAWLRTESDRGNYRGVMSLPSELTLKKTETGYKITFQKVKEFLEYRVPLEEFHHNMKAWNMQLSGCPVELRIKWKKQASDHTKLLIGDTSMDINFDEETPVSVDGEIIKTRNVHISVASRALTIWLPRGVKPLVEGGVENDVAYSV
jgi:sucrose-6-phosphate hydrolase SacC (GH32 family)